MFWVKGADPALKPANHAGVVMTLGINKKQGGGITSPINRNNADESMLNVPVFQLLDIHPGVEKVIRVAVDAMLFA